MEMFTTNLDKHPAWALPLPSLGKRVDQPKGVFQANFFPDSMRFTLIAVEGSLAELWGFGKASRGEVRLGMETPGPL